MKAATVKNRSIQDDQLNTGTLVVKEVSVGGDTDESN